MPTTKFSIETNDPYKVADNTLNNFTGHSILTDCQKMNLSISVGYEKHKLEQAGIPISDVDMQGLFLNIVKTAAEAEENSAGTTGNVSTLREQLIQFLAHDAV